MERVLLDNFANIHIYKLFIYTKEHLCRKRSIVLVNVPHTREVSISSETPVT